MAQQTMTLEDWGKTLTDIWNRDAVIVTQRTAGNGRCYYAQDHNGNHVNLERVTPISDLFRAGEGDPDTNHILNGLDAMRDYEDERAEAYAVSRGVG